MASASTSTEVPARSWFSQSRMRSRPVTRTCSPFRTESSTLRASCRKVDTVYQFVSASTQLFCTRSYRRCRHASRNDVITRPELVTRFRGVVATIPVSAMVSVIGSSCGVRAAARRVAARLAAACLATARSGCYMSGYCTVWAAARSGLVARRSGTCPRAPGQSSCRVRGRGHAAATLRRPEPAPRAAAQAVHNPGANPPVEERPVDAEAGDRTSPATGESSLPQRAGP
jgi:hypothetical protein